MLPHIQLLINNIESAAITRTPNKMALGFTPNRLLNLLSGLIRLGHKMAWIEAKDAVTFV